MREQKTNESYVEYTLSRCSDTVLLSVCDLFRTKADLISAAQKGFNGTEYILGQGLLVLAAKDFISENGYIVSDELGKDANKVLSRFYRNLMDMNAKNRQYFDIDREEMFNVLTDLNWLLSSKYYYVQKQRSGKIDLLISHSMIRIWLKKALNEVLYEAAIYDEERCKQYESAQLTRYQIFSGCYPDQQVRELYAQGYTGSDFKELRAQAHECSIRRMALFYGLTATAERAEEIRIMRK